MKNLISLVIIGMTITLIVYVFKLQYSPCNTPLTYKVGYIDPKFGLQESTVVSYAQNAIAILNEGHTNTLFDYQADAGEITLNFVYDHRTDLANNITKQQNKVDQENTTLQSQIASFEVDARAFERKLAALNSTIQKYNSQGGAPPDVYQELIGQQNELKVEGDALNTRARQLDLTTNDYNDQVESLNQNVSKFNEAIEQKPEEGLWDGSNEIISIYFVSNKDELIHTLAHEFGHALGMTHIDDQKAIMYRLSTKTLKLTDADKQEINAICQSYPLAYHWIYLLRSKLTSLQTSISI